MTTRYLYSCSTPPAPFLTASLLPLRYVFLDFLFSFRSLSCASFSTWIAFFHCVIIVLILSLLALNLLIPPFSPIFSLFWLVSVSLPSRFFGSMYFELYSFLLVIDYIDNTSLTSWEALLIWCFSLCLFLFLLLRLPHIFPFFFFLCI